MKENWKYRILAIVLAILTWHLVSGREVVDSWIEVPLEMANLPKETIIREGMVNRIEVRIRGPRGLVRGVSDKGPVYTVNLRDLEVGVNSIVFDPDDLGLGHALEVVDINPDRLELTVDKITRRQLPVEVVWEGDLDPDYQLVESSTEPSLVEIKGPSSVLTGQEKLMTRPIEITTSKPQTVRKEIGLVLPPDTEASPAKVNAVLTFAPRLESIWVKKPVFLPKGQEQLKVNPREVRLLVNIPISLLRQDDWRDTIEVSIPPTSGLSLGEHELPISVKLPRFGVLLDSKPQQVTVTIPDASNATESGRKE